MMSILRHLFFIVLFGSIVHADFHVSFLDTKQKYENIDDLVSQNFTSIPSKYAFGVKKQVWVKVDITNNEPKKVQNYLAISNLHILETVHFFTIKDGKLIKEDRNWNKYTNPDTSNRIGKTLLYKNEINANDTITVFLSLTAKSNIYVELYNGDLNSVISQSKNSALPLLVMTGMLLSLGVYYLFLYFLTPYKEYIYYVFFVFSMVAWGFYINGGYAEYFDNYAIGPYVNTLVYIFPIWIMLFFQAIYPRGTISKVVYNIFTFLIIVMLIIVTIYVVGLTNLIPHLSVATYGMVVYLLNIFIILVVAIYMYIQKIKYSQYFLIGFSANFLGSVFASLFYLGFLPYNQFSLYSVMIGGVFEAILFSILLTAKLKEVYLQKDMALNTLKLKNLKIKTMNDTLSFISHQWRQPLSQINSAVLVIDDELYFNNATNETIESKLTEIESMTKYMSKTIDDFRLLYSQDDSIKDSFDLSEAVEKALATLQHSFESHGIRAKLDLKDTQEFFGAQNDIVQILLVILNNARDAVVLNNTQKPKVSITLKEVENRALITIEDNAGGVEQDIIAKIFEPHFTTKESSGGSGLGLYMVKLIVEDKLKGEISVSNTNEGALFCITLPLQQRDAQ